MDVKRLVIGVMVLSIIYFSYTTYSSSPDPSVMAGTYSWGSSGTIVTEIQRRLSAWGYYSGTLDGVYGYQTYIAVRSFQAKNGLAVDGVVGPQTLYALGINDGTSNTGSTSANSADLDLLARTINGEARGEPYIGQVAVGAVIINRTRDPKFPQTIAGVVYQPGAFTCVTDGQFWASLESSSVNAARDALNGWDPSGGALYYYNPAKTTNSWIWSRPIIKVIGSHYFCK